MALAPKLSTEVVDAMASAAVALANGGYIEIYDGTKPATADTAVTTQTLMATLYLAAQAFGAPTAGVCTANTIGDDLSIDADGTPTWFRVLRADGISPLWDGTVGTSGCDLNFDSVSWTAGYTAIVSSFTFTASKG